MGCKAKKKPKCSLSWSRTALRESHLFAACSSDCRTKIKTKQKTYITIAFSRWIGSKRLARQTVIQQQQQQRYILGEMLSQQLTSVHISTWSLTARLLHQHFQLFSWHCFCNCFVYVIHSIDDHYRFSKWKTY